MLVKKNNIGGGDANGVNGDAADKAREVVLHLTSGFVADVFGSLVWSPMDVVKQRVMVARKMQKVAVAGASAGTLSGTATAPAAPAYTSSYNAFLTIIREEGPRGLYRGFGAGLATYGPYVSIYFALYEQWKAMFRRDELLFFNAIVNPFYGRGDADRLPFYVYLSGAAGSAALSAVVTTPLDVVKTR